MALGEVIGMLWGYRVKNSMIIGKIDFDKEFYPSLEDVTNYLAKVYEVDKERLEVWVEEEVN